MKLIVRASSSLIPYNFGDSSSDVSPRNYSTHLVNFSENYLLQAWKLYLSLHRSLLSHDMISRSSPIPGLRTGNSLLRHGLTFCSPSGAVLLKRKVAYGWQNLSFPHVSHLFFMSCLFTSFCMRLPATRIELLPMKTSCQAIQQPRPCG